MSHAQRESLDALLRSRPALPGRTIEEQRTSFEERYGQASLGDDVTVRPGTLGRRPTLEIEISGARSAGVVLYLHGGGYGVGSAATGAQLATALARRTGGRAVSLDYRLAPEHPFPAAVEDGLAAYRELLWTGVPADQVAIGGDSAGGGLAIATLFAAREAGLPQPAAVVVFSPWVDLSLTAASMDGKDAVDPIFTRAPLQAFADGYLGDRDPRTGAASPLFGDLSGLAPLLIQVGSHEVLLDDAVRLAARAATADVDVTLDVVAGVPHVFQSHAGILDEADEALDRAGQFIARRVVREVPVP